MDVWGPARVRGLGHERYFLLVVDDYSRYTTVFPLRSKGDVTEVLIDWIRAARLRLRQSFGSDFPVLRLHSDRGGEFSSGLLRAFCRARGIRQTFTLLDSPQQNGIAERRIGMVMDVARTSMMHAAAPHFLWPFAVQYAAHQINLHPRVSSPETSPALLWTGKVGDASAFRVWGSRAFVRDLSADKLSPRAAPCVFLGFPPDAPGWQFYHPTSRRVLSSQDGPAPSGVSQVDAVEPVEATGDSGAAAGAEPGGAGTEGTEPGGAEPGGPESGGAEPGGAGTWGAEPGGTEPWGAEPGGVEPWGAATEGAPPGGALSRREPLSPQELREWFARRWRRAASTGGSSAAEGAAATGPGGPRPGSPGAAGPEGSSGAGSAEGAGAEPTTGGPASATPGAAGGSGATGGAAGGSGAAGGAAGGPAGAGSPAWGTVAVPAIPRVATRPRPYFVPLLQQVLGPPPPPPLESPPPVQSQPQPASPFTAELLIVPGVVMGFVLLGEVVLEVVVEVVEVLGVVVEVTGVLGVVGVLIAIGLAVTIRVEVVGVVLVEVFLGVQVVEVLQHFGFTYSSPQATPLPTRHSLSALPSDESVESSGPYAELVGCLMYLMTYTRPDLAYPLSILARYVAPGRHRPEHMAAAKRVLRYLCNTSGMGLVLGGRSPVVLTGHADASWADDQATHRSSQGYTFGLGSGSVSWRATRSSSVLGSSCEVEIYARAMAAQELCWLTYLLTDLGEPPRSPPVLYVDNKAMLALCREQRLEHKTKHIALRYFLARELQQRGQLRLAYVASEANTADVFTKALAPCDHQRCCTQLGLVPVLPHLLTS
ncbi:unnamed protein product [Closterium sp. NIES-54]